MPFHQKYQKRYAARYGQYKACGRMVMGDAAKALAMATRLKRLVNIEIKNFDVQQSQVSIPSTALINQLTNIPIGDITNQRDGSQCKVVGIEMSYTINISVSATQTSIRMILVHDRQTN